MEGKKAWTASFKGPETAIISTNGYSDKKKPCQDDQPNRATGGGNEGKEENFIPIAKFNKQVLCHI